MKTLASIFIALFLAGCGGWTQAVPQSIATQGAARTAMAHTRTSSDGPILYISTAKRGVLVSYPQGQVIGSIPFYGYDVSETICSDPHNGSVVVPASTAIYQYAHGATTPTATIP